MESQTQTAGSQKTLAAILASIQNIRDENKTSIQNIQSNIQTVRGENKSAKEDAIKQNKKHLSLIHI